MKLLRLLQKSLTSSLMKNNMQTRTCNYVKCGKPIYGYSGIETDVGTFCSEKCRDKITKNLFKVLAHFEPQLPNEQRK